MCNRCPSPIDFRNATTDSLDARYNMDVNIDSIPKYPGRARSESPGELFEGPDIVKCSWLPLAKADLENQVYQACNNQFGTAKQIVGLPAPSDMHQAVTNELLLARGEQKRRQRQKKEKRKKKTPSGGPSTVIFPPKPVVADDGDVFVNPNQAVAAVETSRSTPELQVSDRNPPLGLSVQVESDFKMTGRRRSSPQSEPEQDMLSDHNPNLRLSESEEGDLSKTMSIEKEEPATMDDPQDRARTRIWVPERERDIRVLRVSILADEGVDFENCNNAEDLCDCLLHAMLGWLSMYQSGYLHRDINIDNLLKLVRPATRNEFSIKNAEDLHSALMLDDIFSDDSSSSATRDYHEAVVSKVLELRKSALQSPDSRKKMDYYVELAHIALKWAQEVKDTASQLGVGKECKGIVSNSDLAAYIPTYFTTSHDSGSISDNYEFMSASLRGWGDYKRPGSKPYLQSPVDDIESFYWVAIWAALHNKTSDTAKLTFEEEKWRKGLRESTLARTGVASEIGGCQYEMSLPSFNPFLQSMWFLLGEWREAIVYLRAYWNRVQNSKCDDITEMVLHFDCFAYKGVLDFLKILSKHIRKRQVQGSELDANSSLLPLGMGK